jgi:hypothetical protein
VAIVLNNRPAGGVERLETEILGVRAHGRQPVEARLKACHIPESGERVDFMKNSIACAGWILTIGLLGSLHPRALLAGETNSAPARAVTEVRLPYGADKIVEMSQAQISDDVIVGYVRGSSTVYDLTPDEVILLKQEGVSDPVVQAMLDKSKPAETAAQSDQPQVQESAPVVSYAPEVPTVLDAPPLILPIAFPCVEPAPAQSTLFIIRSPAVEAAYYGRQALSYPAPVTPGVIPAYGSYARGASTVIRIGGGHASVGGGHHVGHHGGHR